MSHRIATVAPLALLAAVAAGCGSSPPARYWTLEATIAPAAPAAGADAARAAGLVVAVGPVTIPASVDRPQLVVQVAPNRVALDELDRWAAPLADNIARVVAADLATLLCTPRVTIASVANADPAFQVAIEVQRFDSRPGEGVAFEAFWTLRDVAKQQSRSGRTSVREPAAGAGLDAIAAAHSRALAQLSRDLAAAISAASTACSGPPPPPAAPPAAKLFDDLGHFHRAITTSSTEAQRFFDQGLLLCYAFNHEEAIRSFARAAELDPSCAMAYWGMALAAGPNINNPTMDDDHNQAASDALAHATALARPLGTKISPVERELIGALSKRYVAPPPADRKALDVAYADAMRAVWKGHPDDADVGALFAESLLDLRPWDQWAKDGSPQPGTLEAVAAIDAVLQFAPLHVGANHYCVHALEGSLHPERALRSADRLRDLVPGAGHLVHMPAHIDLRIGHYAEAIEANRRGIAADARYVAYAGRENFYSVYRSHNFQFLAYAAMFDGQSAVAIEAGRDMVDAIPSHFVEEMPDFVEAVLALPYHVLIRFGRWDELLREPDPGANRKALTAFWRYARTMALSALGRVDEADRERALFEQACLAVPPTSMLVNNTTKDVLDVARPFAEGELEYRHGRFERAFELLREAVKRDDALRYDEPWGWMQPARHALGALLLEQGRVAEAEAVYRDDLVHHPENGWSLHGLAECLHRSGKENEAAAVDARFKKAWSRADVELRGSCYCRTGRSSSG